MRPIWKGHISFGLVNVPVTLYPAEQRSEVSFHLIDRRTHSRVRYQRVSVETGEEVPWDEIVKGYEYEDGNYVVLADAELKAAAPESTQTVDIEAFVDLADIDLVYFDKPYYLEPGRKGEKGYALLRDALAETGKAGIARLVIRTREYIAALVPREQGLVLNLLRFHDEIRPMKDIDVPGDAESLGVTKQELKMARTLVDSMAADWKPEQYKDRYQAALLKYIDKKIKSDDVERAITTPVDEDEPPAPISIMEALKKSLAQKPGKTTSRTAASSSGRKKTKKKAG